MQTIISTYRYIQIIVQSLTHILCTSVTDLLLELAQVRVQALSAHGDNRYSGGEDSRGRVY